MSDSSAIFKDMSNAEFEEIKSCAVIKKYKSNETIFSAGDKADLLYVIQSGKVSVRIDKSGREEEICALGMGDYFGEMAMFNGGNRSASVVAMEDSTLLGIDKEKFIECSTSQPVLADKIKKILEQRDEELFLREKLINTTGIQSKRLHVTIKGDPSMRQSAFTRERYESVVDNILVQLAPRFEELLFDRCVYQIFIGLNNGEIRTSSVFDPFVEEIHTANKFTDKAYIDRHFPKISYEEKSEMIASLYQFISKGPNFAKLPERWKHGLAQSHDNWRPASKGDISGVLEKLIDLRNIPDFYLRNFIISMMHDAIRMQFNCDGTHIVSAEDYQQFIKENVEGEL